MSSSTTFQEKLKSLYRGHNRIAPLIEGLEGTIPQQSLEDYYVKLKTIIKVDLDKRYLNYERIPGKKREVNIEALFDPLETANKAPVNKLLIVGGAGVGKSTLMQYIAYKWSRGELWKDKFDYVYRVSLKTLLNRDWDHNYGRQSEDDDDILKCLVHHHLVAEERGFSTLKEIPWKQEKSLLLLDGYDEVAHERKGIYKKLFEDIFDHKNIILTSRPNAINKEMAEKFGRKIENVGFDNDGIHHYLTKYFRNGKSQGKSLEEYLEKNLSLKDICRIPVNIAMICFIWDGREALQQVSNLSDLYHKVVDHLGFRCYAKQEVNAGQSQQDLECRWKGQEIYLDELKVLQHCAYKGMTGGGIEVSDDQRFETLTIKGMTEKGDQHGVSIQSSINYLSEELNKQMPTINRVYQYGLLKPEGVFESEQTNSHKKEPSETDLQAQSFSFIHLSFQEFLAARYFVEKLTKENNDYEQANIANFIAQHRNEPRYLMTLKFMAGRFSSSKGKQAEKGIRIFWDTVMCNPDGVLELGIETKVILLMHLLSQTAQEDDRIPNRNVAVKLIDCVALRDLAGWSPHLRESDYISENIKEGLMQYFVKKDASWLSQRSLELQKTINVKLDIESNLNIPDHVDDIMRMISVMINKFSYEEQEKIFQRVLEILKDYNETKWQCIKKAIESIITIHRKTKLYLDLSTQKEVLDSLLTTSYDNNLNEISSKAIEEAIKRPRNPALLEELIKTTKEGLADLKPKIQYRKIKTIIEVIRECNICDKQFTRDLVHALIGLLQDSNQNLRTSSSKDIITLLKIGYRNDSDLASYAINEILPLLKCSKWNVKMTAFETILGLVRLNNEKDHPQPMKSIFSALASLLHDDQQDTKTLTLKSVVELVLIDEKLAEDAINTIRPLLKYLNLDVRISAMKKILELGKIAHDIVIFQDIFKIFTELLRDPDLIIRDFALDSITKLVINSDKNNSEQLERPRNLLQVLIALLEDSNLDIRISALKKITELVKFSGDTLLETKALNTFSKLLQDSEPRVKTSASKSIIEVMKRSGHKDPLLFKALLDTLNSLLHDRNPDISISASNYIREVAQLSNDTLFIRNIIENVLMLILQNSHTSVQKTISKNIISLVMENSQNDPDLFQDITDKLLILSQKSQWNVKISISEIIAGLLKSRGENNPQLVWIVLGTLTPILCDPEAYIRKEALDSVIWLMHVSGANDTELITRALKPLTPLLEDQDAYVRKAASDNIAKLTVINQNPKSDLVRDLIEIFNPFLQDPEGYVRKIASDNITELTNNINDRQNLESLIQRIFNILSSLLRDSNQDVRNLATKKILEFATKKINEANIFQYVLKIFQPLLSNSDWESTDFASKNIIELMKINDNKEVQLSEMMIKTLVPFLENASQNVRITASKCLTELAKIIGNNSNIEVLEIVERFIPLLQDPNREIRSSIFQEIVEILEISDDHTRNSIIIQKVFNTLDPFLSTSTSNKLMQFALTNLQNGSQFIRGAMNALTPLFKDFDQEIKTSISTAIISLLETNGKNDAKLITETINSFSLLLQHSNRNVAKMLSIILKGLFKKLLGNPDSLPQYFDHQSEILRDIFTSSLLGCLKNYVKNFQVLEELFQDPKVSLTPKNIEEKLFKSNMNLEIKNEIQTSLEKEEFAELKLSLALKIDRIEDLKGPRIIELALIITNKEKVPEDGSDRHQLIKLAHETLNIQLKYLRDEGLIWINENHKKLLSLSPETKFFYRKTCHKMLEDEIINPLEEALLIKLINHGLTTSLTTNGGIFFDGKRYKLKGNDSKLSLEKIAKTIIGQQQDILAAQYQKYEPLFVKIYQQEGMREAAVDKKEVKSVVDSRHTLTNDSWLLTRLRSLKFKSEILLLEHRSVFGDHFIYHLSGQKSLRFYPNEILGFQEIFGSYIPGELYQGELKELNDKVGQKLLENQEKKQFWKIEGKLYPKQTYFQQELLRKGSEDKNEYLEKELANKLDNNRMLLEENLKLLGLSNIEKQAVEEYYDGFVSTFSAVYTSSQSIADGKLAIDDGTDYFSLVNLFVQLSSLDPFGIGDIAAGGLNAIRSYIVTTPIRNEAKFIKEIAINDVELSELICKTAMDIISYKPYREKILKAKDDDPANTWLNELKNLVLELFEKLRNNIKKYQRLRNLFKEEIERSPAFKLGTNDANAIMKEWIQLKQSQQNLKMTLKMKRKKFVRIIVGKKKKSVQKAGENREENKQKNGYHHCQIF